MNLKSDAKLRRKSADSKKNRNFFSCCMDRRPTFGQIGEIVSEIVQKNPKKV